MSDILPQIERYLDEQIDQWANANGENDIARAHISGYVTAFVLVKQRIGRAHCDQCNHQDGCALHEWTKCSLNITGGGEGVL